MSGVHGMVAGHLLKRGYHAAQSRFAGQPSAEYMAQLQSDAALFENSGPETKIQPYQVLPIIITGVLLMVIVSSIRYTLGEVMASLSMIESRTATAIIEDKPPAYADEPDAPLEKEPLMPREAEADVEVTLIANKPITAKISTTMKHLRQVGGFRAKWRGLGLSVLYHFMHASVTSLFSRHLGLGLMGNALTYVLVSCGLARIHMVWTHSMIAYPSTQPFWRRLVPRKQCGALVLPTFVFAAAQQATYILPLVVAYALGLPNIEMGHVKEAASHENCGKMVTMGLRVLAVPATGLFVAFAILLPSAVTLTRIEALLLPETEETIVPFDRQAIIGNIDLTARGSRMALFVSAWRSFDRASRWRLIKLYAKMIFIQVGVVFAGIHLIVAEMYLLGGEKLALLIKSGTAQLKLTAVVAHEKAQ